jgi:rare lipoprotein A (peptidoglycan hydrolase)
LRGLLLAGLVLVSGHPAPKNWCLSQTCRARVQEKIDARQPMRSAVASYYGPNDSGGPLACTGEILTSSTLGIAHKTWPCGKRVRVCAKRCLEVRVKDRGPFVAGREVDLTIATAQAIGFPLSAGVATIRVSAN